MIFKRKPNPPLEQAIRMIHDAVEIAYPYVRDKSHQPTTEELIQLDRLRDALWQNHATVDYILRRMQARAEGKPEESAKFRDPAVCDYHYYT